MSLCLSIERQFLLTHRQQYRGKSRETDQRVSEFRELRTRIHSDTTVPLGFEHKVHTLEENVSECVCMNERKRETKGERNLCACACQRARTPAGYMLITCTTEAHADKPTNPVQA